ncbi:unnamed protein product [Schistosoma bovis]|nr:unnamed protein product [Schistosoma bovis]
MNMTMMMMMMMMKAPTVQFSSNQFHTDLEYYDWLNLLEIKVQLLLLFPNLLLIVQKNSNDFFTVIKDLIYHTKIIHNNIPQYASDQLMLQYMMESNRKRDVHSQGSDAHKWLVRIQ